MGACVPGVCDWYHAAWPHLRRLGLVSNPGWHADFYAGALAATGTPVLIGGAADETMLAHVLRAAAPADVTVLDLCDTPLEACRRLAPGVRTVQGDVLAHDAPGAYATIVTDAFLPRFPAVERPAVLRAWRRLLRPGGTAVTTVRIGGAGADRPPPPPAMRAERLRRAALARAGGPDAKAIAALAHEFGLRQQRHAVGSAEEALGLFAAAGFAVRRTEEEDVGGTPFLRVVAVA